VENLGDAVLFVPSPHALERCQERGIGVYELYSAIAEPDAKTPAQGRRTQFVRGDIAAVVDESTRTIVTIIDRLEDIRSAPRVPISPLNQRTVMARKNGAAVLDEAWALVAHDEPDMRKVLVTPVLAEKLLTYNTGNRPFYENLCKEYMAEIEAGNWRLTHQGVALSVSMVLQDGQHRLTAIVRTGKEQWMFIAVGMADENFSVLDTGRVRRYKDVLSLAGYPDPLVLGSAARMVYLYTRRDFVSTFKVSNTEVLSLVESDPDAFRMAVSMGVKLEKETFCTRTAGAATFYLIRKNNAATPVNEFFASLITGEELHGGDPRLVFRRVMANMHRDKHRKNGPEQMAMLLKTWNAWVEGRKIQVLAWKRTEAMPRVTKFGKGAA
jgi:hypothetical protein